MAKKTFKSGLDSLLQTTRPAAPAEVPQTPRPTPTAETLAATAAPPPAPIITPADTPQAETRATFIVDAQQLEQLRAYAYWERLQLKEALYQALEAFLQGRDIPPIPQQRRGKK